MKHVDVTHALKTFSEEINNRSGKILEEYRRNERAFVRSLLPNQTEVKTKDVLQAGVAMKVTPVSIELHPYVYRQVCSNGCIFGKSTQSHKLRQAEYFFHGEVDGKAGETIASTEVDAWLRRAVDACCRSEAFYDSAQKFHTALHVPLTSNVGVENALLASLNYEKFSAYKQFHEQIMREYLNHDEPSLFRLVNAVTAVARDLHDAEQKWKLEAFAGNLAWSFPHGPFGASTSAKTLSAPKAQSGSQIVPG